jgi:hypothetical protein
MADGTFDGFSELVGERARDSRHIENACDVLDELPCTDLLSLLTISSEVRSGSVSHRDVVTGNRFHAPATLSQKDFHWLEGIVFDASDCLEFVELSPLQPFGINHVVAGTNQKNVVSALRRSEVNADATTALFRLALQRHLDDASAADVRLGSNVRTVRAQQFDADTKFLPHFKVFGEVSVGKQGEEYGKREIEALATHLDTEVGIIDAVVASDRSKVANMHTSIGNLVFLYDLVEQERVDLEEVRRNTANPAYSLVEANDLDMPEYVKLDDPNLIQVLNDLGIKRGIKIVDKLLGIMRESMPGLLSRVDLHLGRIAGVGYYRHLAYKVTATNTEGLTIPIADGGTTDWATKVTSNKQLFTVTSGIGTELMGQYLIT